MTTYGMQGYGADPFGFNSIGSSYNPFQDASAYNNQYVTSQTALAQQQAQQAYWQASTQQQSDALAFQKAQQAYTNAMGLGTAYGYAPGGNWYQYGAGGATQPSAGTPTLAGTSQQQTLYNQQLANQLSIAGVTGTYSQPTPSQYTPGTILTSNNGVGGNAYGIVQADGSVQMTSTQALAQTAAQRGMSVDQITSSAQPVDYNTLQRLSQGPPTGAQQQTQAAQQQQYAQSAQSAGLTGMFYDPTQTIASLNAQGRTMDGQTFANLPQDQQQYWLQYNQNNPTAAAQAWAAGVNSALQQAGVQPQNQGAPTLQMQSMYGSYGAPTQGQQTLASQAQNAGLFGSIGAPTSDQQTLASQQQAWNQQYQTAQFGLQAQGQQQQAAQQYLQLLSQLQGPADYGQYLKVLGSTPAGLQGLVGAAAGRYVPGGGTTGVAPQAQTLQNLVGAATGQAGSGNGSNAATQPAGNGATASPGGTNYNDFLATAQGLPPPSQIAPQSFNMMNPSQKQMLGSMYSNIGYAPTDINSMFSSSLPKYAAGSAAGSMRLV